MVMQRPLWVLHLLQRGYETLQVDLDIAWVADPQPLFALPAYRHLDLAFQSEGGHGFNGGFYFARPTNASLTLLRAWLGDLRAQSGSKAGAHRAARSVCA